MANLEIKDSPAKQVEYGQLTCGNIFIKDNTAYMAIDDYDSGYSNWMRCVDLSTGDVVSFEETELITLTSNKLTIWR